MGKGAGESRSGDNSRNSPDRRRQDAARKLGQGITDEGFGQVVSDERNKE